MYFVPSINIKKGGWAEEEWENNKNEHILVLEETQDKRLLEIPGRAWADDIKMGI